MLNMSTTLLIAVLSTLAGAILGTALYSAYARFRGVGSRQKASEILAHARREVKSMRQEAELEIRAERVRVQEQLDQERKAQRTLLQEAENRLEERNTRVEAEFSRLQKREDAMDARTAALDEGLRALQTKAEELQQAESSIHDRLANIAQLTPEQAKTEILRALEKELESESAALIRKTQEKAALLTENKARDLLIASIQRYAADQTASISTTVVHLPDAGMKGRIIGREGRNIRALEMATGVTFIIDDAPEAIILSSFDPIRREIARAAIEHLVADGRINPALIEEAVEKASADLDNLAIRAGEDAVAELNLSHVSLELLRLLGRLRFRSSYSQNVLRHSIEAASLAGMMAAELGLSVETARRAALFHDIGKALDHHVEGRHAEIGADILRKAGEDPVIVNAVRAHHGESGESDAFAALIAAADAITAARPGAREDNAQDFLQRMENLEAVAKEEPGVIRALAMEAGRELRIFVEPVSIDDNAAILLARRIARTIEQKLNYPGQIKVTVIRETRCVEYAK